jgi:hypothetical protein
MTTISRRHFLGALGAGTAAAAGTSTAFLFHPVQAQPVARPPRFVIREDRFGRIFP